MQSISSPSVFRARLRLIHAKHSSPSVFRARAEVDSHKVFESLGF